MPPQNKISDTATFNAAMGVAAAAPVVAAAAAPARPVGATHRRSRESTAEREAKKAEQDAAAAQWLMEEDKQLQPRREATAALENVAQLRASRQIGENRSAQRAREIGVTEAPVGLRGAGAALLESWRPSMQSYTVPGAAKPLRLGGTAPGEERVISPTRAPVVPDLGKPREELLREATGYMGQLTEAIRRKEQAKNAIDDAIRKGTIGAAGMPALAKAQKTSQEEVLNLVAQLREYGFKGTNEEFMEKFAPKQ